MTQVVNHKGKRLIKVGPRGGGYHIGVYWGSSVWGREARDTLFPKAKLSEAATAKNLKPETLNNGWQVCQNSRSSFRSPTIRKRILQKFWAR